MQFSDSALEAQRKHEKLLAHLEAQKKVPWSLAFPARRAVLHVP